MGTSNTMNLNFVQSLFIACTLLANRRASWKLFLPNLKWALDNKKENYARNVKYESLYHSSPSRKISLGMSAKICGGKKIFFPCLLYIAFFRGFQKPRMPSYFSNSHLHAHNNQHHFIASRTSYQLVGSTWESVRKHAVVGSPISSMCVFLLPTRKLGGICRGIGWVPSVETNKSGLAALMVATKL